MKPKHEAGYSEPHAEFCERTLVTLLRGLGPWKAGVYLTGGLVPRYLIPHRPGVEGPPPHAGTTDVDLVLDLELLARVEAYRRLENNLKTLGFERGTNDEGHPQHFSWRKPVGVGLVVVVDLLRDVALDEGGHVAAIDGERRLSTLGIPGARLVVADHIEVELTAELLDERGVATENVRVANIVPFIVLKALAYDDRVEEKDAYDLIYCLMRYADGPPAVAAAFADGLDRWPDDPLPRRALTILRARFASDERTRGARKDGPTSYARFRTNPGQPEMNARHRQDAASVVEAFLGLVDAAAGSPGPTTR